MNRDEISVSLLTRTGSIRISFQGAYQTHLFSLQYYRLATAKASSLYGNLLARVEMEAAPGNQNGVYSERVSDEADKLQLS